MNKRVTINRLRKLADHLDHKVAVGDFKMCFWKCGTVGCAIGHGCSIPSFRRAGLHLINCTYMPDQEIPKYLGETGIEAVATFFGITPYQAERLFCPLYYEKGPEKIRPRDVVRRLRKLAKEIETDFVRETKCRRKVAPV